MRSADKNSLAGTGMSIANQRERLLNLQKRQKLKDLLITKFMQKYKIKNYEKALEDEITKFLQGEKLTDQDLKRLDIKIKQLLKEKATKERLKEKLTQSMQGTLSQNDILPKIETKNVLDNTLSPKIKNPKPTILTTDPLISTLEKPKQSSTSYKPLNTYGSKRIYKKPEEELAELEAEFAKDEEESKKNFKRLDFSDEGDEWSAIAKYNRKLYEDQIKMEKIKDEELKRRNKADLDFQVKQKLKQDYENELKEKEYDKIQMEYQKELDEIDRKKQEDLKKQLLREKQSRDEQIRQNYILKRIETLKEKKFEKSLVKTIQEGIEKERLDAIEKKKKENEALVKAMRENDIKLKMKKEIDELLEKMKKEQEEEDKRIHHYYEEKNRLAIEKEKRDELKKFRQKFELKKYLDMQIAERKKEEDFLKSLDYEQARIWAIDCKKYNDDEKAIENKIREMNKRNMTSLMDQINKKKSKNKNAMNDTEYAMNRKLLEKAKTSLAE